MDLFDVLLQAGLITGVIVAYLICFSNRLPQKKNMSRQSGWNYPIKLFFVRWAVKQWKSNLVSEPLLDTPREKQSDGWDCITFRSTSPDGTVIFLAIRKLCGRKPLGEITVHVKLPDGTTYKLPRHPDTLIAEWNKAENMWSVGGLKVQVLEPQVRMRILYNGLLTREHDKVTQHVKLNLIWAVSSQKVRHPEEWSDSLAARALASAQWRDGNWSGLLSRWEDGNWVQWGSIQGRFESYDSQGVIDESVYLRTRGVKERSWAPYGHLGLRRSVVITAVARDGTMVQLRGISHKDVLSECISGSIRYPGYSVESITNTDLFFKDFCETPDAIPRHYTINVSTKSRSVKVILKINADGGNLLSGVPYQQEMVYRTAIVNIDGELGTGLIELCYESSVVAEPSVHVSQSPQLKWLSVKEVDELGYCLPFESRAATCPNYVGGKGASLALLSSVQSEEGYRVPSGFCISTKALQQHLLQNPKLMEAVRAIEAASESYEENNFQEKCKTAVELFATTEITKDVQDEIIVHFNNLKKEAVTKNMGSDIRFAVRSSAVGEDSEALSAAGQNETILGCASLEDVLQGVQKCWGSMFAFTSAYYRRQNGQPCVCGGAVVVQVMVSPRVAGVMFTRHPQHGDPRRLVITANYGLGESVVSGSVEPDTVIVTRGDNGNLLISKIELGSKSRRVTTASLGVTEEDVPESERKIPCLTASEVIRLAQIGISQEELWGAGRDIEWAINENEIFLLQARPITSLERWTDEELLHEFDFPIMSDDEILTFANTGEVLPRPLSALSIDIVLNVMEGMVTKLSFGECQGYDKSLALTHNRLTIAVYNTLYRRIGRKIDVGIRMSELAIHGRKVATDHIINVALHRRQPKMTDKLFIVLNLLKVLIASKSCVKESKKVTSAMDLDKFDISDPLYLLDVILENGVDKIFKIIRNHMYTTIASSGSQYITMSVFLEGDLDFTTDQCHEITTLLSSGDVLSASVPFRLEELGKDLENSGRVEEFRAQNPKDAMKWLQENLPQVYQNICKFLEEHGHRAIMELDLMTKPWVMVPEELMQVLQNIRVSKDEHKSSHKTDSDVLGTLKTPKKSSTKKVLRWLLPLCRRTVRHREATKAHLTLGIHKMRLAFNSLGRLLVRQWYLPHEDLIFFFRLHELRDYIQTRDPHLLKKASQRRQYYPGWCKLQFSELCTGWPEPLSTTPPMYCADMKISAMSVCGGEVVARACVVKSLSEIGQLQHGDILITHSTDIGWSPYFPLISGIVTELGGLISHGAVIAREYGLPCLVGATNATDIFKTGDIVRLSATLSTLERIKSEEKCTADDINIDDMIQEGKLIDI